MEALGDDGKETSMIMVRGSNWDREQMMTTQCAVEPFKGVYQYVEGRLRKGC